MRQITKRRSLFKRKGTEIILEIRREKATPITDAIHAHKMKEYYEDQDLADIF